MSPDHVFDFLADDPALDVEEDPEEDPKEEQDMDIEEDIPSIVAPPDRVPYHGTFEIGGPSSVMATPPHLLGKEVGSLRQDTEALHGSVRTLTRGMETRRTKIATLYTGIDRVHRRMDAFDVDIAFVEQATSRVEDDVLALQARA
ncbi:hypothetical protein Tco_0068117 [Tanacetum coccineum]